MAPSETAGLYPPPGKPVSCYAEAGNVFRKETKESLYAYLVHYDLDVPAEKFCDDLLDQKGVLVCHGDCFNIPHSFRITLSHAYQLEEGLRRIDEYIDELVAQGKAAIC